MMCEVNDVLDEVLNMMSRPTCEDQLVASILLSCRMGTDPSRFASPKTLKDLVRSLDKLRRIPDFQAHLLYSSRVLLQSYANPTDKTIEWTPKMESDLLQCAAEHRDPYSGKYSWIKVAKIESLAVIPPNKLRDKHTQLGRKLWRHSEKAVTVPVTVISGNPLADSAQAFHENRQDGSTSQCQANIPNERHSQNYEPDPTTPSELIPQTGARDQRRARYRQVEPITLATANAARERANGSEQERPTKLRRNGADTRGHFHRISDWEVVTSSSLEQASPNTPDDTNFPRRHRKCSYGKQAN